MAHVLASGPATNGHTPRRDQRPVAMLIRSLGGALAVAEGLTGLPAGEEGARNVRAWVWRDSIPAEWFTALAQFAAGTGHPEITVASLAAMAQRRRLTKADHELRRGTG